MLTALMLGHPVRIMTCRETIFVITQYTMLFAAFHNRYSTTGAAPIAGAAAAA